MLYRTTNKTEATEIVIIDSQMNYRGELDTYVLLFQLDKVIFVWYILIKKTTHEFFRDGGVDLLGSIPLSGLLFVYVFYIS